MKWTTNKKILVAGGIVTATSLAYLSTSSVQEQAELLLERYVDDGNPERILPIRGINVRNNPSMGYDTPEFIIDLKGAYAMGFNSERVFIAPIYYTDDVLGAEFADAVNTNFPSNIIPVLFDEISGDVITKLVDKAKADGQADPLQYCKDIINKWVPRFPNVYAWEITNEPLDDSVELKNTRPPEYYQNIRDLITYLHTKTNVPITIGFNYQHPKAFNELIDSVDIIGFHYYPSIGAFFGGVLTGTHNIMGFPIFQWFPRLIPITISGIQKEWNRRWITPETSNPAENLKKIMDYLSTYNKPFIISEWGYAQAEGTTLEPAQALFVQDMLKMMKQYQNPNFLGYHYYAYRETSPNGRWGGIVNWERRIRTAAQWFP